MKALTSPWPFCLIHVVCQSTESDPVCKCFQYLKVNQISYEREGTNDSLWIALITEEPLQLLLSLVTARKQSYYAHQVCRPTNMQLNQVLGAVF